MTSSEVKPLRWRWLAVVYLDSSSGPWAQPTLAAELTGISTAKLRRWADAGVLTTIYQPGEWRRYFQPELAVLNRLAVAHGGPLTLRVLKEDIHAVVTGSAPGEHGPS